MTEPEVKLAKCKASAVKCCGRLPVIEYVPGLTTITCQGRCGFTESLPDWTPGHLTSRWNARILGPEKFRELGFPGISLNEYCLTSQLKKYLEE